MEVEKKAIGKGILAGRFHIICELGTGGNADVKLAFDEITQKKVAVKVMKKLDPKVMKEVENEVSVMT